MMTHNCDGPQAEVDSAGAASAPSQGSWDTVSAPETSDSAAGGEDDSCGDGEADTQAQRSHCVKIGSRWQVFRNSILRANALVKKRIADMWKEKYRFGEIPGDRQAEVTFAVLDGRFSDRRAHASALRLRQEMSQMKGFKCALDVYINQLKLERQADSRTYSNSFVWMERWLALLQIYTMLCKMDGLCTLRSKEILPAGSMDQPVQEETPCNLPAAADGIIEKLREFQDLGHCTDDTGMLQSLQAWSSAARQTSSHSTNGSFPGDFMLKEQNLSRHRAVKTLHKKGISDGGVIVYIGTLTMPLARSGKTAQCWQQGPMSNALKFVAKRFPVAEDSWLALAGGDKCNLRAAHAEAFTLAYMRKVSQTHAGAADAGSEKQPSPIRFSVEDCDLSEHRCHVARFCGVDVRLAPLPPPQHRALPAAAAIRERTEGPSASPGLKDALLTNAKLGDNAHKGVQYVLVFTEYLGAVTLADLVAEKNGDANDPYREEFQRSWKLRVQMARDVSLALAQCHQGCLAPGPDTEAGRSLDAFSMHDVRLHNIMPDSRMQSVVLIDTANSCIHGLCKPGGKAKSPPCLGRSVYGCFIFGAPDSCSKPRVDPNGKPSSQAGTPNGDAQSPDSASVAPRVNTDAVARDAGARCRGSTPGSTSPPPAQQDDLAWHAEQDVWMLGLVLYEILALKSLGNTEWDHYEKRPGVCSRLDAVEHLKQDLQGSLHPDVCKPPVFKSGSQGNMENWQNLVRELANLICKEILVPVNSRLSAVQVHQRMKEICRYMEEHLKDML